MTSKAIGDRLKKRVYYGWVMVGTLALTETVSWGVLVYAFSVFLVPMRNELGWSEATLTGAYSLAFLISGVAAPFVGRWIDRNGARVLMTIGSILGVVMMAAWSRVDEVLAYYLIWVGIGLAMATTLYEPAFTAVTGWFDRDRAKAILLVTICAGFASTIFLPLSSWLVDSLGWREALLALAVILGVTTIPPHALLLRRQLPDAGAPPDGRAGEVSAAGNHSRHSAVGSDLREALQDRAFWWLGIAFSLETFATIAVALYMIPYLTDRGDGARFAAAATGLIGAAQVAARILATMFGGRISQVTLTTLVFALQAVAISVLLLWESRAGVLSAVVLLGMGRGVVTLMRAGLVAEFYGRRNFGAINGSLAFLLTGSRALGPIGAGILFTLLGGYRPVFWLMAAISLFGAGAMTMVRRYRDRSINPAVAGMDITLGAG